jgi:hypothetical protein
LFDANGNVLAGRNAGTGLPSNPNDPYILTGLAAGTYYVGVSGAGNQPYGASGYDPVMGIPGTGGLNQPGGPFAFQLGLLAQPHDRPTKLVNFTVDRADPADPSPTGLTLTFNGPIDLSHLFVPDTQSTALEVVDSSGQVWPFTPEGYDVTSARLNLVFNQPLPAGHYSLLLPSQNGLTDLALVPVTAAGEPSGVLADWTVAPSTRPSPASDLGVLWAATTGGANPQLAAKFSQTTNLTSQQATTFRWVVTVPGFYKLQTQVESGSVSSLNLGSGQPTVLEPGTSNQLNDYLMYLGNGVYSLRFINTGSAPLVVHWTLKIQSLDWEKIVDNGVSQQSALSLMSFAPTPSDPGGDAAASVPAIAGAVAADASAGPSGPLAPGLFVTLNTGLIGLPTSIEQNVAPVGPTVETGSIALADSSPGLHPGIRYEFTPGSDGGLDDGEPLRELQPVISEAAPADQEIRLASSGMELRLDPEARSARADEHALDQAEWLVGLGSRIRNWLMRSPAGPQVEARATASYEARSMAGNDAAASRRDGTRAHRERRSLSSAQADIGAAASLIIVGTVAFRLRQPIQKWWQRGNRRSPGSQAAAKPFCHGPHPVSTRARAASRSRRIHSAR